MSERKVSTDALETLGMIIDDEQKRDAIHLAVIPVVAAEKLSPGQDVGVIDGDRATRRAEHLGIVDPFLKDVVRAGQHFWLVIYPRKISSLRHVWSHPAFADEVGTPAPSKEPTKSASVEFLRCVADAANISYERLLEGARYFVESGEYLVDGGRWQGFCIPDGFWDHYEIVTGKKVADSDRSNFFSCSC